MKNHNYNTTASSGGIGIFGVLQIIFIVLKCLDLVSWTWLQVFIPTFIGLGISAVMLIALFVYLYVTTK